MLALLAQVANSSTDSPPATPRLRPSPIVPACRDAARALRRAAPSDDASGACPSRKPFSRFSAGDASLAGEPLSPHVFLASVDNGVTMRFCVRRCDLAVRHASSCWSRCFPEVPRVYRDTNKWSPRRVSCLCTETKHLSLFMCLKGLQRQ